MTCYDGNECELYNSDLITSSKFFRNRTVFLIATYIYGDTKRYVYSVSFHSVPKHFYIKKK